MSEAYLFSTDILGAEMDAGGDEMIGAVAERELNDLFQRDQDRAVTEVLGDDELLGDLGVRTWDNGETYEAGDVVYHNERNWRATRKVEAPWFPLFQSGEVPGESDAWWSVGAPQVNAPPPVLGAFDIQMKQREMNGLKQVTVGVAQALLSGGQRAIARARQLASKYAFPADNVRDIDEAHWKLQWHQGAIAGQAATPQALYGHGEDLKKWVVQAFIEANAAEEGAGTIEGMTIGQMWVDMWTIIRKELAKLPAAMRKAVSDTVEWWTGIPLWAWALGGAALVGVVGYGVYRVATGPAGGAVTSALAAQYFGRRA